MAKLTVRDVAIAACAASAVVHAWLFAVHLDELLLSASFGAAAVALALMGVALTQASLRVAPAVTTALFAALLAAYPIVTLASEDSFDALGLATKGVEAAGLAAALGARRRPESFGSADAVVGILLATLLISVGGHEH